MNWNRLKFVAALAQAGSYRAAARLLNTSPVTVSRNIELASSEYDQPLFLMRNDKWEPTRLGSKLAELATHVENGLTHIDQEEQSPNDAQGKVTLHTISYINAYFLAGGLKDFIENNPRVSLTIDASDATLGVERGQTDIGLRLARPQSEQLIRFKVCMVPIGAYTPRGTTPSRWIGLPEELDWIPDMVLGREAFGADPALRLDSFAAIAMAAQNLSAGAIFPTCIADKFPGFTRLNRDGEPIETVRDLWFTYHENRLHDPLIIATKEWIRTLFPDPAKCMCGGCSGFGG